MGNNKSSQNQSHFLQNYQIIKANQSEDYFYLNSKPIDPSMNGNQSQLLHINKNEINRSQFVGCKLRAMGNDQQNRIENILKKKLAQQNANQNYSIQKIKKHQRQSNKGYCSSQTNFLIIFERITNNLKQVLDFNRLKLKNRFNEIQIQYLIERIANALLFLDQIQDPCQNLTLQKILVNSDNNVYLRDPFLNFKEMEDQNKKTPVFYDPSQTIKKQQTEKIFSPEQLANIQTFNSGFDSLNSQLFKLGIIGLQMYNLKENYTKKLYLSDGLNNKKIDWKTLNQELQLIKQNKLRQKIKLLTSTKGSYRRKIYDIISRQNQNNPQAQKYNLKQLQFFPQATIQSTNSNLINKTVPYNNYSFMENQQGQSSSRAYSNDLIKFQRERKSSQNIHPRNNNYKQQSNINFQNFTNKQLKVDIHPKIDAQLYAPIKLNTQRLFQSQNQLYNISSFSSINSNFINKNAKSFYHNSMSTNSTYNSPNLSKFQYPQHDKVIQSHETVIQNNMTLKQPKLSTPNNINFYMPITNSINTPCFKDLQQPYRFSVQSQYARKPDLNIGKQTNFSFKQLNLNQPQSKKNNSYLNQIQSFKNEKNIIGTETIQKSFTKNQFGPHQNDLTKYILNTQNNINERQNKVDLKCIKQQSSPQKFANFDQKIKRISQNIYSVSKKPDILINDLDLPENKNQEDKSKLFTQSQQNFLINIIQKQSPKSRSQQSNRYSDIDIDSPIPYVSDQKSRISKFSQKKYFQPGQQLEYVIQQYENGSRYQGYKKNGFRHGHGKFYYQQGSIYEGQWKNNQMHGYGKLYYSNGELAYEGQWFEDEFNGFGKVYNDKPTMLDGSFDYSNFNNLEQQWIYYDGQLKKDAKQGHGKIMLQNGEWFQGQFKEDRINGEGVFWNLYGDSIKGIWEDSVLIQKV